MVETIAQTPQVKLRSAFTQSAQMLKSTEQKAQEFISAFKTGEKQPSPDTLQEGHNILRTLEEQQEVVAFNGAVLVGQQDKDDSRLDKIKAGIEKIAVTADYLRRTLGDFSAN